MENCQTHVLTSHLPYWSFKMTSGRNGIQMRSSYVQAKDKQLLFL